VVSRKCGNICIERVVNENDALYQKGKGRETFCSENSCRLRCYTVLTCKYLLGERGEVFYLTPLSVAKIVYRRWWMNELIRGFGGLLHSGEKPKGRSRCVSLFVIA
jgi:hypothetical protein